MKIRNLMKLQNSQDGNTHGKEMEKCTGKELEKTNSQHSA